MTEAEAGPDIAESPDRIPSSWPPALGFVIGVALMLGAAAGSFSGGSIYIWLGVLSAQAILIATWHRLLGAPAAETGMIVGALLIAAADIAIAVSDIADRPVSFGPIAAVLAVGYLLAIVQQLARRDDRHDLTLSLSATVSLAAIGALGAGWAVLPQLAQGDEVTVVAATAVTAATVGRNAPRLVGAIAVPLIASVVTGMLMGRAFSDEVGVELGAYIGFAAAIPVVLAAVAWLRFPGRSKGWQASAVWPILLAVPLIYLVLRFSGH